MALEQREQFGVGNAGQQGRIGDLVAVQVQDGQHRAIARRVQEADRLPRRGQRPGFSLAVADHGGHDQRGIVERGAEGMREAVTEFAALVDRARHMRRAVRPDAARGRKPLEQARHAGFVPRAFGVAFRIMAVQIGVRQHRGGAVAGTAYIHQVQVVLADQAIQVGECEGLAGAGAPVPQDSPLDVRRRQRLAQQGVGAQVQHPGAQVIAGLPVGVQALHLGMGGQGGHGGFPLAGAAGTAHAGRVERPLSTMIR